MGLNRRSINILIDRDLYRGSFGKACSRNWSSTQVHSRRTCGSICSGIFTPNVRIRHWDWARIANCRRKRKMSGWDPKLPSHLTF